MNLTAKFFGKLPKIDDAFLEFVVRDVSQVVYDETQKGAGRHTKTGALFQSVFNRPIKGGRVVGHDEGRAPYAKFVLYGSRPHIIRPKKKALRWASGNGWAFAKFVRHPGYKGDPYLIQAAETAKKKIDEIVSKYIKE
jgi:hypothetical protein